MAELSKEKPILGKIIAIPGMMESAIENGLKAEYFLNKDNRSLFNQMLEIYNEHGIFERSFLKLDFEEQIKLSEYSDNVVYMPTAIKALKEEYKNLYLDKKINDVLVAEEKNNDEKRKEILSIIENMGDFEHEKNKVLTPKGLVSEWWKNIESKELDGIRTGYSDLDKYMILEKASLITVGARPAIGKTAFGINLAYRNAIEHNVLYVNLEMSTNQITNRILSSMSKVELWKLTNKKINDEEAGKIVNKLEAFEKLNLSLLDCTDNNFHVIVQEIKRIHEKSNLDLIVIDYLTLMQAKGFSNKNLEVEYMANKLKALSKELNTCIVVLAQLSREVDKRADKRPIQADLRDSGGIEQASNIVMFLYRDDYYSPNENSEALSFLEIILRKNRNGDLGTVVLGYNRITQEIRTLIRQKQVIEDVEVV